MDYSEFFVPGGARDTRSVTNATGQNVALVVSNMDEAIPHPVVVHTTAGVVGSLNVAGAATVYTDEERHALFNLTVRLFGGSSAEPFRLNRIALGSGGTRVLDKTSPQTGSMTAVEVPGLAFTIARQKFPEEQELWPHTWGHTPRTHETLGYGGEFSSFELAEKKDRKTIPNPELHLLWILQKGASKPANWNGDLPKYIELLELFANSGVGQSGLLVLSGGGVTAEEVRLALGANIPVLGAVGTGRAADALVHLKNGELDKIEESGIREHYQAILDEERDLDLIRLFSADDPVAGQKWFQEMGFGVITL